jgi:drug/metabolite transporter (DMT)-like permease
MSGRLDLKPSRCNPAALTMRLSAVARQRAMFAFLCFVWGTTWLGMKVGIAVVPPGVFAGTRWTIAGLVLLAVVRFRGERVMPPPRLTARLVLVAVLLVSLNQVIQLYGLKHITAGLAAVISSALTPIALLGFSVALGQEAFTWRQLGAMALGVIGILVLFGPAAFTGTLDVWQVLGALGVIIGCLSYSLGSVLARPMMRTLAPVQMSGLTNLIGGAVLFVTSVAFEPGASEALTLHWGWPAFAAWLYLLIPGSLLSTTMYFLLVRDWGASRTGTYAFVSPVIAVAVGSTLFGEELTWADVTGMVLMLSAAALVLRRR